MLIILLISFLSAHAQEDYKERMRKQYETFQKHAATTYSNFRQKANAQYAEFMRKNWEQFHASPPIPVPECPDPVKPPVKEDPDKKPIDNPVPQGNIIPLPEPQKQPQPLDNIPIDTIPDQQQYFSFSFYNVPCKVSWNNNLKFHLPDLKDSTLATTWEHLAGTEYNEFLVDCIQLRAKLSLCDWAFIELLQQLTSQIYQSPDSDESVFLQMFVLCQTGYKVRIARSDKAKLALLISTDYEIYNRPFIKIEEDHFYVLNSESKQFDVLPTEFPKEQSLSLRVDTPPALDQTVINQRLLKAKDYPGAYVKTGVNKGAIDFYNSYPYCDWKVYAGVHLSKTVRENTYPTLEYAIKNKSETEAANILINFVQTAFEYKTDDEQFGYERPLFPDETFYYPYSDCEDRAILFSRLVRDLLHLDVVLLHYPGHLATAVHFNQEVEGDYLMVNNVKYLVCDPTYIGAPIGDAMPQFKKTEAEVVILTTKNE
jgi:hypothetical protein